MLFLSIYFSLEDTEASSSLSEDSLIDLKLLTNFLLSNNLFSFSKSKF